MGFKPFLPFAKHHIPRDLDKPNFIFSSDIPSKIKQIVSNYFNNHYHELKFNDDIVDLADEIIIVNVNIELNTLLMRNKNLRPSDLIKENLIFLARSSTKRKSNSSTTNVPSLKSSVTSHRGSILSSPSEISLPKDNSAPKSPTSINGIANLYNIGSKETFIVSLSLKLLDFIINIKDLEKFRIDFLKDENYGLLLLCDIQLITQLEDYIKKKFVREIKHTISKLQRERQFKEQQLQQKQRQRQRQRQHQKHNLSSPVELSENEELSPSTTSNTTTTTNPTDTEDENSTINTIIEGIPKIEKEISISDTTFDSSIEISRNEKNKKKLFVYDNEEDDFDGSSLEDPIVLNSNNTSGSNAYDEDNDGVKHSFSTETLLADLSKPNKNSVKMKRNELFLGDINNLRHNEDDVDSDYFMHYDDLDEVDCDLDDFNKPEATLDLENTLNSIIDDDDIDDITTYKNEEYNDFEEKLNICENNEQRELCDYKNTKNTLALRPAIDLTPSLSFENETHSKMSPTKSLARQSSESSINSSDKGVQMLSRRTSSTFSVTTEENKELDYAFKSNSPLVPSYIKQNKKFKFIKVGKVQKFVNLFEEKKAEELPNLNSFWNTGSNEISRNNTRPSSRPSSPLKKGAN